MKLLKSIPSNLIVAIDIETVRYTENFGDLSERFQDAFGYKNKQDGEVPNYEDLSVLWEKTSSLYAEFSKVCAVSICYTNVDGNKLFCEEFYGEDEETILADLAEVLKKIRSKNINYRLVGHAAKFFDYPFLCKRYVINGIDIPDILDTAHLKPWEQSNLCTNEIWKMGGTGAGSSLQALCTVLDIPISKVDLVGDEVGKAYFNDELERISRYCSLDTIATFNVIRKLKKESIFQFEDVRYLNKIDGEKMQKVPCLVELYNTKVFSDSIKEEITKTFSSQPVTSDEYGMLESMLTDLYINNKMFSADSAPVQEQKRKEVAEFMQTLRK